MSSIVADHREELLADQEVKAIRARFPVFKRKIYLNSCSQGALCDAVRSALQEQLHSWDESGSPWEHWVEEYERCRAAFAEFIGAAPDEVAVIPSASAGISAIASALRYEKRKRIVMGEFEFPTMGQIWLAQQNRGAEVHFVNAVDGSIPLSAYEQAIDGQCQIVPLTRVCFMNGWRSDVRAVTEIAHNNGALVMLDDYQDCGTRPINVKSLNVDFYVSGALKYLLAPSGIAFLYVRRELIEPLIPTVTGWFGQTNPFAFDVKHFDPAANARRFEAGSPPVPQAYAVRGSLGLLANIGLGRIASHVRALTQSFLEGARKLGIKSKTPYNSDGPLTVLQMKDVEAVVRRMADEGIVVSNRMDGLRVSFHVYNTIDDVHAALQVLEKNLGLTVREPDG